MRVDLGLMPRFPRVRVSYVCLCLMFGLIPNTSTQAAAPTSLLSPSDTVTRRPAPGSEIIIRQLPNGLTYYILRHPSPAKRAMLWLSVNVGSIHEDDDQRGFAHFLEHMAFNGTSHFPGLGVVDVMEKAGMSFGADVNAYTSLDETVYKLTIPTDDSIIFAQGMQIIQDWASGGILNDSAAVAEERGVVMGEWRMRFSDSIRVRAIRKRLQRIYGEGSRYVDRLPIGDPALLQNATPTPLKRFYSDWYRPDLMAVIAVGDFDPEYVEGEIIRRFGSIPAPANPRPFERPRINTEFRTKVEIVEENPAPLFELMWPVAPIPKDPEKAMRAELIEQIALPHLQGIATELAKGENRPFSLALIGRVARQGRVISPRYIVRVHAAADSILPGARTMLTEIERVAQHGLPDSVLKRDKDVVLNRYIQAAHNQDNQSSQKIAGTMSQHFLEKNISLRTADSALKMAYEILPAITSADIADFVKLWRTDSARIVKIHTPPLSWMKFVRDTAIMQMLDSITSQTLAVESSVKSTMTGNSEGDQGVSAPGTVTATDSVYGLNVRVFTLSNGARVVFKPSYTKADEVIIHAYSPGGHSLLPDSLWYSPGQFVATLMTSAGRLGGKTHDDLTTTGIREFSVRLNTFSEEMTVRGSPAELENMLRMIHVQFVNPPLDSAVFKDWRNMGLRSLDLSTQDQLTAKFGEHPRFRTPQILPGTPINIDQAMAIYRDRFGDASDFIFFVVGAIDSSSLVPGIERYLANLPSSGRSTPETPGYFKSLLPTRKTETTLETLPPNSERAGMNLLFRGSLSDTVSLSSGNSIRGTRLELQTLSIVLSRRLRQKLREEMAVTYSVGAPVIFYKVPEPRYAITVNLLTKPSAIDTSTSVVWDVIHSLQANGPTDEELQVAHMIMTRQLENSQQSNQWWISRLVEASAEYTIGKWKVDNEIPPFTRDQIRQAANRYLSNTLYAQKIIKPIKLKE